MSSSASLSEKLALDRSATVVATNTNPSSSYSRNSSTSGFAKIKTSATSGTSSPTTHAQASEKDAPLDQHHHHPHEPIYHDGHIHPHPHTHHHTVIHAVRGSNPPRLTHHIRTRKHLIARPRVRQYFTENGDLHKQCDDGVPRQAGKFELFLDLLYVGLVANFAEDMVHHPTSGSHLAKYILIFVPVWQIWADLTSLMNVYYNDDIIQRILIIWIMLLILLYGNNATYIDVSLNALRVTAGSFILARVSVLLVQLYYSLTVTFHSFQLRVSSAFSLLTLPLYTPLFLPTSRVSNPVKIGMAILAYALDRTGNGLTHNRIFHKHFKLKHTVALDIDHHVDRMAAFYIIVLGEFLYGLVWLSPIGPATLNSPFGRAAMSLVIAFCLCWLYMSSDGSRENPETGIHAIRWRAWNGMQWYVLHLPLSMGLLVAGEICAVFVKYGVDSAGIHVETHLEERAETAGVEEEAFPAEKDWQALRWLFCGGLAVGMVCLCWISCLHHEVDEDEHTKGLLLFSKRLRRITRLPVAIIIACLPLASPESLSITKLLGTVTGLLMFSLLWEMVGSLDRKEWSWTEGGKGAMCEAEEIPVYDDHPVNVGKDEEVASGERNDVGIEVEIFDGVRNVVAAHPGETEHGMIKCPECR